MSFFDEINKQGGTPAIALKMLEGDPPSTVSIAHFSDIGIIGDGPIMWEPKIERVNGLLRSVDLDNLEPQVSKVTLPLRNEDDDIAALAAEFQDLFGVRGEMFVKYIDLSLDEQSLQIGAGIIEVDESEPDALTVTVRPLLSDRIGKLQRTITATRYPTHREKDTGSGSNILTGVRTTTNGATYCPMIEDPVNAGGTNYRFEVAQGYIKGITKVIRSRGGNNTTLGGGQYTFGYAQDADLEWYSYIQLTNGVTDYQDGDDIFVDYQGIEDVGDGSGVVIHNPSLQTQIILERFSQLDVSTDLDSVTWGEWETRASSEGLAASGVSSITIPWKTSAVVDDPLDVLAEIAQCFDVAFYVDDEGKIAVTDTDIATQTADPTTLPQIESDINLAEDNIKTRKKPLFFFNKAQIFYGAIQNSDSGFLGSFSGEDTGSIEYYRDTIEAELFFRFINDDDAVQTVANRRLLRSASKARRVIWPFPDLGGLAYNPGDHVGLNHPEPGVDGSPWQSREAFIESVELDHERLRTTVKAITIGDTFGPIKWSGEFTSTLLPLEDLWIDSQNPTQNYTNDTQIRVGDNLDGVVGSGYWRLVGRIDLSVLPLGATITEVAIDMFTEEGNNDGNPIPGRINPLINGAWVELSGGTAWTQASTYNVFSGGSPWSDTNQGNDITNSPSTLKSPGWKTFAVNSAGLTFLNANITGVANMTFNVGRKTGTDPSDDINEYLKISSYKNATRSWRIRATYTV